MSGKFCFKRSATRQAGEARGVRLRPSHVDVGAGAKRADDGGVGRGPAHTLLFQLLDERCLAGDN